MLVVEEIGKDELAKVYVGKVNDHYIEFAESVQPPLTREEKWVVIISCLYGCPVKCLMCDAGQKYFGKMSKEEIIKQIDCIVEKRFPDRIIPVKKFKIQFTRMGEPAFNNAVLDVLKELPSRYDAPGLMPSISSIGPKRCADFFENLLLIKKKLYGNGQFQMQFSIHTTDLVLRDKLIPTPKMSFHELAKFGDKFFDKGDRKITLNFIVMNDYPIDPQIIKNFFDPAKFIIKLTPLNPTSNVELNKLINSLDNNNSVSSLVDQFHSLGFETIISIGELEENEIGSNCGQYVSSYN